MPFRDDIPATMDSYPYVTGMGFRNRCHMVFDEFRNDPASSVSSNGQFVFVKTDYIKLFEDNVLPLIDYDINIITHNSALGINEDCISLLENPKIINWFAQNANFPHPKLLSLPLGLANYRWMHGDYNLIQSVNSDPLVREHLMYMNFDVSTNSKKRTPIQETFLNKTFVKQSGPKPFGEYIADLRKSKFTVSPPGAGIDCHRIWESISVGTIPVVERCHNISFYEDMPILIVDDWGDIDEDYLNGQYEEILKNTSKDKLFLDYWIDKIGLLPKRGVTT